MNFRSDQSLMIRNMEVINQNINKRNEKKKKDKRNKREHRISNEQEKSEHETSLYSACILSANCLSSASNILQEVSGESSVDERNGATTSKTEISCLMTNLYHLDRTLNLLSQNIKRQKHIDKS